MKISKCSASRAALGVCMGSLLIASVADAASLRAITDVWGGQGNGNIAQGCTTYGSIPDLTAAFGTGGFRVLGGNAACGYAGGSDEQTAASGTLLSQRTLAAVPLNGSGSTFGGAAKAIASYGALGAEASGVQVGTPNSTSATFSTGAAFFQDTLTATSAHIAPSAPGFVRYVFDLDGSMSAPVGGGGLARVQLNIQQAGGPYLGLAALTVQAGDPAIFSAIDGSAAGWSLGVGTLAGTGSFGSTVHVPFLGDIDLPMNWGDPWDVTVGLLALSVHTADASFSSTARLVDIQLFDANHQQVTDFSLSAASRTNYLAAAVPEPQEWALLALGLAAVALCRRHGTGKRYAMQSGAEGRPFDHEKSTT